jgi:BlaI family penicillinase repressor
MEVNPMGRPTEKDLTKRELEVLQVFWDVAEMTAIEARDRLAEAGVDLAYVTVANLVRILVDKGYLRATNGERPFRYAAVRSREDVSGSFVGELIDRVFGGSRENMLLHLLGGGQRRLTAAERKLLKSILEEQP